LYSKIGGAQKAAIEKTIFEAAGDHAPGSQLEHRASAIEPQAVILFRRSVTADTILTENRLHIAREIHFGGRLRVRLRNKPKNCDRGTRQ
jgi:hypothetical protein